MNSEKFSRITEFEPAFDKRDPNPSKNYGIHSVHCRMVLTGKKGAVGFNFATGMYLESTMEEYIMDGRAKYSMESYGLSYLNKPLGFSVDYHSPKPTYDGQTGSREKCDFIGCKCFSDGSFLEGERFMKILIEKGSDEIWKELEKWYNDKF